MGNITGKLPQSREEAEMLGIEDEIIHVHPEIREPEPIKEKPKEEKLPPRGAPGSHLNPAFNNPNREIYDAIVTKEREVNIEEINFKASEIHARVGRIITGGPYGKSLQLGIQFAIYVLLALIKRVLAIEARVNNMQANVSADSITDYVPISDSPKILDYFNTPSDIDGKTDEEIKSIASEIGIHVGNTSIKNLRRKLVEIMVSYMPKVGNIKINSTKGAIEKALEKKKERNAE